MVTENPRWVLLSAAFVHLLPQMLSQRRTWDCGPAPPRRDRPVVATSRPWEPICFVSEKEGLVCLYELTFLVN